MDAECWRKRQRSGFLRISERASLGSLSATADGTVDSLTDPPSTELSAVWGGGAELRHDIGTDNKGEKQSGTITNQGFLVFGAMKANHRMCAGIYEEVRQEGSLMGQHHGQRLVLNLCRIKLKGHFP